jgi:hypothetical protein
MDVKKKKKKQDMKGPFSIFNCFGMVNLLLLPSRLKKKSPRLKSVFVFYYGFHVIQ